MEPSAAVVRPARAHIPDPRRWWALGAVAVGLPDALIEQLYALRLDDAELLNPGTWGIP